MICSFKTQKKIAEVYNWDFCTTDTFVKLWMKFFSIPIKVRNDLWIES